MERQGWFRFLDRHHYIHHIDTSVNLNFLLPLCDLMFGTLKREPTKEERARWPSFEEAKGIRQEPPTLRSPGLLEGERGILDFEPGPAALGRPSHKSRLTVLSVEPRGECN